MLLMVSGFYIDDRTSKSIVIVCSGFARFIAIQPFPKLLFKLLIQNTLIINIVKYEQMLLIKLIILLLNYCNFILLFLSTPSLLIFDGLGFQNIMYYFTQEIISNLLRFF